MDGLPFTYLNTGFQEPIYASTTIHIPTAAPMLAPIFQPDPAANDTTNAEITFIPQLLTRIQQMQQLMVQMQ